jgi:hypothetical protein
MKVKALKKFLFNARMIEIGDTVEMDWMDADTRIEQGLVKELKVKKRATKELKIEHRKTKDDDSSN